MDGYARPKHHVVGCVVRSRAGARLLPQLFSKSIVWPDTFLDPALK
jgi:hypothetical protein